MYTIRLLCLAICLMVNFQSWAQEYLVLDRYGNKRIRIPLGSQVHFKLKGDKRMHSSRLAQLTDSVVVLGNHDIYLTLEDFDSFYFYRPHWRALRKGAMIPAWGFLLSAAVHPLVDNAFYDQKESAYLGFAFLGIAQSFRLLEWKRFRINRRSRIWIGLQ